MPADLDETIVFEIPFRTRAESLREALRLRWHTGLYECDDVVLVAVELRPRADDLARLLRAVKLWLEVSDVGALRFHLDARAYVLEPSLGLVSPADEAPRYALPPQE
jgi:hypothetical protein